MYPKKEIDLKPVVTLPNRAPSQISLPLVASLDNTSSELQQQQQQLQQNEGEDSISKPNDAIPTTNDGGDKNNSNNIPSESTPQEQEKPQQVSTPLAKQEVKAEGEEKDEEGEEEGDEGEEQQEEEEWKRFNIEPREQIITAFQTGEFTVSFASLDIGAFSSYIVGELEPALSNTRFSSSGSGNKNELIEIWNNGFNKEWTKKQKKNSRKNSNYHPSPTLKVDLFAKTIQPM